MNRLKDALSEVAGYMDDHYGEGSWCFDDGETASTYEELVDKMEIEDAYWEDRYTWIYTRGGANVYRIGEPDPIFMARRYEDDGYPGWMPWEFGAMNR